MKLAQLSVVAATALVAMTGVALAAPMSNTGMPADCGGCTVTVFFDNAAAGAPPLPAGFTPLNLGTSPLNPNNQQPSPNPIPAPGGGIASITFTDGLANGVPGSQTSGLYAGNIAGVAASPFGANDSTTNYLLAQPGGSVGITLRWTPKMRQLAKVEPCP
jgi:hypothetical protein